MSKKLDRFYAVANCTKAWVSLSIFFSELFAVGACIAKFLLGFHVPYLVIFLPFLWAMGAFILWLAIIIPIGLFLQSKDNQDDE